MQLIQEIIRLQQMIKDEYPNISNSSESCTSADSINGLLPAINKATNELLLHNDFYLAIEKGLIILGNACNIDRIYLYKNSYYPNNNHSNKIIQWQSSVYETHSDNSSLHNFSFADMDILMEALGAGTIFNEIVSCLNHSNTKTYLQSQSVLSILAMPIFIDSVCWGFIRFDECKYEHKWSIDDIALLKNFINSVTRTIERFIFEQKLIQSEERYKRITDGITDYLYSVILENGKVVQTVHNPGCIAITGFTPEEFMNDPYLWIHMVIPEDREKIANRFSGIRDGLIFHQTVEHRIICKNGKIKWVSDTTIPKHNNEGELISYDGVIKDISERKQAEFLLQQTRQNYESFFNTIDEFLFVLDNQGNIIHTNNTVIERLGYVKEELIGKSVLMVHPQERREEAGRIVGEMLQGISEFCPVPIITKTGVQIPVETRVSPGFWDGNPVIFGVTKDISKLKLSEEKFSKLFHLNPSACGLSDLENQKYIEVNDAFYSLFGFQKDEVIGKTAIELGIMTPDLIQEVLQKALANDSIINIEANLKAKNGDMKYVLLSSENIYLQEKKMRYTVVHDITDRKQAELALQENNSKLEIAMKSASMSWWKMNIKTGHIWFEKRKAELLGFSPDKFKHYGDFMELIHPKDYNLTMHAMYEHLHGNMEKYEVEYRIRTISGEYKWFYDIGQIEKDIFGKPTDFVTGMVKDITERKLAEQALKKSEEKYRLIAENTTDVIWNFNIETRKFTYISPSIIHLSGFTPEEALNLNLSEMLDFNSAKIAIPKLDNRIRQFNNGDNSAKTQIDQFRQMCKNGSSIWVEMASSFILDNDGKIIDLLGVSRNIEKRKEDEEKLAISERRYKTISRLSSDFSYSCIHSDGAYQVDWITEAFFSITGYSQKDLDEQKCWLFVTHADDRKQAIDSLYQLSIGEHLQIEFRIVTKNGLYKTILNKMECVEDSPNNGSKRIFGAVQDITDRKITEEVIKENESRLSNLVHIFQLEQPSVKEVLDITLLKSIHLTKSSFGYIYVYNDKSQLFSLISYYDNGHCDLKESELLSEVALSNSPIWLNAVGKKTAIVNNDFNQLLMDLVPSKNNLHIIDKHITIPIFSGNKIVAIATVANKKELYSQADILHLTLLMNSVWKVVERKNIEIELIQKNNELLELNADKDRFVSILAHDLKSPFNTILGFLNLLTDNIDKYDIDKIYSQLNLINTSAHRVFNLLEDTLLWARAQSGKIPFEPQKINFHAISSEVIDFLKPNAIDKNISINCFATEDIILYADANMVKIVLRNLLSNAIKFTNNSGKINLFAEQDNSMVTITVADNGVGIQADTLSKLFSISHKISTDGTANEKGTGIGLLLCKEFVEKHGGKIWVQSNQSNGCSFSFTIKRC